MSQQKVRVQFKLGAARDPRFTIATQCGRFAQLALVGMRFWGRYFLAVTEVALYLSHRNLAILRLFMFEKLKATGFEILTLHHAEAILKHDMPQAVSHLEGILSKIRIPVSELISGGGGEGKGTQRLRNALAEAGWEKHRFEIRKIVDGIEKESISHEIDHVRAFESGVLALEIEWNNKDPFFDRDLENFKRLHADGVISVGAIITRGKSLHDGLRELVAQFAADRGMVGIDSLLEYYTPTPRQRSMYEKYAASMGSFPRGWAHAFVSDKFGEATTHWKKLEDRVKRGVGNPCPLLLIGIPKNVVV